MNNQAFLENQFDLSSAIERNKQWAKHPPYDVIFIAECNGKPLYAVYQGDKLKGSYSYVRPLRYFAVRQDKSCRFVDSRFRAIQFCLGLED